MLSPAALLLPLLAAPSAMAYPWVGDIAKGGELDERGLFDMLKTVQLGGVGLMNSLNGVLKSYNPGQMEQLGVDLKKGIDYIYQQANSTEGFGGWPTGVLQNAKGADLTKDVIYEAFKLDRSAKPIWHVAEDEEHPWVAPGPGDQRGPCPGLNTLANHGYLPHNGIVSPSELISGVWEGLSMSPELGALLTVAGFVFKGDLNTMKLSIGGQGSGGGVGLSQHGLIEGDASITRQDSAFGDPVRLDQQKLQQFKNEIAQYGTDGFDINPEVCAQSRYNAYQDSIRNNPSFDFNPTRQLVAYAESAFAMEVFRGTNVSCTADTIDWFFNKERFPPGWTRRNIPVTANEMLAWGMLFYKLKPTQPVMGLGFGQPISAGASFIATGTVKENTATFASNLQLSLPIAMQNMGKALGVLGY